MQKLRIGLAVLVTTVWLVGYGLAYETGRNNPTELTGLMTLVLGWAFAGTIKDTIARSTQRRNGDSDGG